MKLSRELGNVQTGRTLYVLDEPTTGLHFEDIRRLLAVLQRLVDAGNSVVVIEHNLDVVKCSDWVIDLGPEGGDKGGEVRVRSDALAEPGPPSGKGDRFVHGPARQELVDLAAQRLRPTTVSFSTSLHVAARCVRCTGACGAIRARRIGSSRSAVAAISCRLALRRWGRRA